MKPPLEGELVRLRAPEPEDEPYYYQWINDPEVTYNLLARYPFTHAQELEFIAKPSSYGYVNLTIVTLGDALPIGNATLRNANPENRSADLGIMIGDRAYWDRGYGTDAMRTICRFGFEVMNLHRIELDVFADNARAIKVYERLRFVHEGRKREAHYRRGEYVDVVTMGLLAGELR